MIRDFACDFPIFDASGGAPPGASPGVLARFALSSVTGSDQCSGTSASATLEAEKWITQQSCDGSDIGTFGGWDVNSSDFIRLLLELPGSNSDATKTSLLALIDGDSQHCTFHENPVGPIHSGDESANAEARETENHLLFIESNRFLFNQLQNPSDNTTVSDGYTVQQYLQLYLQELFRAYFYEYNSPRYEKYHAQAISNLFEKSSDISIKTGSRMILDLLAAHEAVSTKDLRRMVPYRRWPADWNPDDLLPEPSSVKNWEHAERDRYQILTGESRMLTDVCPEARNLNIVGTALGTYRLPDPILDRFLNRSHQRGYERIHLTKSESTIMSENGGIFDGDPLRHGWEVFYQDPDFLLSAGGVAALNQYGRNCLGGECQYERENAQDVWTTLIPTGGPITSAALTLRVQQPRELDPSSAYNETNATFPPWRKTCVGPNFACGQQVVIPPGLCTEQNGPFTFVNYTNGPDGCIGGLAPTEAGHGFFAAVFTDSGNPNWGFFEVEGINTLGPSVTTLRDFETAVLARNVGSWSSAGSNTYRTVQGDTITFGPVPFQEQLNITALSRDCSTAVNPGACAAQDVPTFSPNGFFDQPNLGAGDFITNADPATGVVNPSRSWIRNPFICQQVVMDYANASDPFYVDPVNQANRLCQRTAGTCPAGCTATKTFTCSCSTAPAECVTPSTVSGLMAPDVCTGFLAGFVIDDTICPSHVALWSAASSFGNPSETFVYGNSAAPVVLNGQIVGTPAVGFQFDYPPVPSSAPAGCHFEVINSRRAVTCDPVNHHSTIDLSPGRYVDVTVNNSGELVLHPGDYMFDSLVLNPGSTLQLPSAQRVRIFTASQLKLSPQVACAGQAGIVPCDAANVAANLGFIDAGTTDVVVGMTTPGTVVAPNALIRVLASNKQTVYGSFWSDVDVIVGPFGTIRVPSSSVFLDPAALTAYPACP